VTAQRIQRKRTKGWRMPANTVSVCRPGKWGNPFTIGSIGFKFEGGGAVFYRGAGATAENVVSLYRERIAPKLRDTARVELAGKNLACWCLLDQPCHADVLLEMANS
jgi:Domain of unknown function (DUF4326)